MFKIWCVGVYTYICGQDVEAYCFYPTALKGCQGIVFTHGVQAGKSLSGLCNVIV